MKTRTKEGLVECVCIEPKSAKVLDWSHKVTTHLCAECQGKYQRPSTEQDYRTYFHQLLPPTLDRWIETS
jgi:hypothetical protein